MSGNAETIVMIGGNNTGAIWRHNKTEQKYDLIRTNGFEHVYKSVISKIGRSCTVSGDGNTVIVGSVTMQWGGGHGVNTGFRVYTYNKDSQLFEHVQYVRYANISTGGETEENTSHDFLAQTGGTTTIGQTTPISSWVRGASFGNYLTLSYDGNWLMMGGGTMEHSSYEGLAALFKFNGTRFEYVTNFVKSQYGFNYTTGARHAASEYDGSHTLSSDGKYIFVHNRNSYSFFAIMKRNDDNDVYTTTFSRYNFGINYFGTYGIDKVNISGSGEYLFYNQSTTRKIYKSPPSAV
jgi:hypothetical protein